MPSPPFSPNGFSGVVRVGGEAWAFGSADRAHQIPNRIDTQFAIASGVKGFTALVAVSTLPLTLRVRELLGDDLPLVDDRVTVEHLLRHTSGIGDYLDEDVHSDWEEYLMPIPVHELATTSAYLRVLDGHAQKFTPGERFSYSNSGFVLLAVLAERASGRSFYDLVDELVCRPADMRATAFLRSDSLPGTAAIGYLSDGRTNVFHLPVRGSGDGGIYTSAADMTRFWEWFVHHDWYEPMTTGDRYGLGFWLDPLHLEGIDAGVWFMSRPGRYTALSNDPSTAPPVARALRQLAG
ncbi:MAG TPA: serine hydrolase domain-containing protein [Gaiellaceae bacterium]|nr:serine hydrolase domain-containing protein [Gaiellaceae bacterium]